MNVVDALPRSRAAIHHETIPSFCNAKIARDVLPCEEQRADQLLMFRRQMIDRRNVLARNDQNMNRRLRIDVVKRQGSIVFVSQFRRYFTGDNAAEDTIVTHMSPCTIGAPRAALQRVAMKLDALLRAAQILRKQPYYAMPLSRLHACLTDELGNNAGTYGEVYQELKKRPQSFMVLEPDPALEPGLGSYVHVTLIEETVPEDPCDVLSVAAATLNELWQRARADNVIQDYLAQATDQLAQMNSLITPACEAARPTTPVRDPLP